MTPPLPRFEPLQYADYAYWQRQILRRDGSNYREAIAWWKKHLKREPPRLGRWQSQILRGVNSVCRRAISGWKEQCQREPVPVEIPFQRESRLPGIDPTEGLIDWPIDLDQERRLHRLSRRSGASLFVVWLAALVLLLADETGGSEVIVGTYMTSRRRHPALLNMIGCFTSLVALRFQCDFTIPFSEWLFEVRSVIRAAQDRSDIPYDELSKVLDNLGIPPPEVRVIFHQVPRGGEMVHMQFANLELRGLDLSNVRMPRVFRLELRKRICRAHFDAEIYDPVGVQRFLCRLCSLLDAIAQHPQEPIGELAGSIRSAA